MSIAQVVGLAGLALLLGWATHRQRRSWWLLAASIVVLFWLQPALPLRGLPFLLPLLAVGLTVASWVWTATPSQRRSRAAREDAAFIAAVLLAVGVAFYSGLLGAALPPSITDILLALAGMAALGVIILRLQQKHPIAALWLGFGALVGIFVVLKTPALLLAFSRAWRALHHQNPSLATLADVRWLGFSYLAFRLLHTIRDRQTGRMPEVELGEYVAYALFFPAIVAGPIDRIERFVKDLRRAPDALQTRLLQGGERVAVGLFKKFVLADTLAMVALNPASAQQAQTTAGAWVLLYAYALQIYFDFSGYTDIAIGLGLWMGIRLPENFRRPYLQTNISTFWNNWHMTLTQWFRAYFFNPLARQLRARKEVPMWATILLLQAATMTLIGLWHGVRWHFVVWGLWHGVGLFVHNRWAWWMKPRTAALAPWQTRLLNWGSVLLTFHFVALGWVWFVLPLGQGWAFLLRLGGLLP